MIAQVGSLPVPRAEKIPLGEDAVLPEVKPSDEIPKLIHQIYRAGAVPSALVDHVEHVRRINPGWQHTLYNEENIVDFISQHYGADILHSYESINPGYGSARADFFRYLLMYYHGGVYLDIKSSMTSPLDELIKPDDRFILSQWRNGPGEVHEGYGLWKDLAYVPGGDFQQWHIIASPGHPFLRRVIENVLAKLTKYDVKKHGVGQIGVNRVTGEIAYTEAIFPMLGADLPGIRRVANESDIGLQYSVITGLAHVGLFASNYRTRTDPIVLQPGIRGVAARAYCLGYYSVRKRLKKLLRR